MIFTRRAQAKSDIEDYRGAIKDYKKAIKKGWDLPIQYMQISDNYAKMEKYKESIHFLNKVIEHEPSEVPDKRMARAFYNRGIAKIIIGNKEEGCMDLSKAGEMGYEKAYKAMQALCNN